MMAQKKQDTINISAGLIPKQASGDIDISAGLVPKRGLDTYADGSKIQAPQPGLLSRAWNAATRPIMDNLPGGADMTARALMQQATGDPMLYDSIRLSQKQGPNLEDSQHPLRYAIKQGMGGAMADTADTTAGFTSPVSLATAGLGVASKGVGAVSKLAQVGTKAVGAGFALKGAADVADATTNSDMSTPDRWQKGLQGGGMMAGGAAGVMPQKAPFAGKFAAAMNEKTYGQRFTPGELSLFAKNEGVPLDASQVTQSPGLQLAHDVAKKSFGGGGVMKTVADTQKVALESAIKRTMDGMSPDYGVEGAGSRIGGTLSEAEAGVKAEAQQLYDELHKATKGKYGVAYEDISPIAQKLVDEHGAYYKNNPQFKPKFWDVVTDIAERGKHPLYPRPQLDGFETFHPDKIAPVKPLTMPFNEAQMLRSDLLEHARNNTDTIKSRPQAWADVLSPAVDNAMMKAGGGLPADLQEAFRNANAKWSEAKGFDNNRSVLYNPVRQVDASKTGNSLFTRGNQTAETARNLNNYLGDDAGVAQRDQLRRLTDPNNTGTIDLNNLHKRVGTVPGEFLNEFYGPETAGKILKYGDLAKLLTEERNPSGTARVLSGIADAKALAATGGAGVFSLAAGNPAGLLPLAGSAAQVAAPYGIAKLLNSPKVTNYLTKPASTAARSVGYGSLAAAMAATHNKERRKRNSP